MNDINKNAQQSSFDIIKWAIAFLIIAGGVAANYYFRDIAAPIRIIGWIVLLLLAFAVLAFTRIGKNALHFGSEARVELRKVVWPTRQETVQTTTVIVVLVLVIAALLWVVDSGLIYLVGWLTGQRGL